MADLEQLKQAVTVDPEIMSGTPVFAGTRVPIQNLFDYLEGGYSVDQFLEAFHWVSREHVLSVLNASGSALISCLERSAA